MKHNSKIEIEKLLTMLTLYSFFYNYLYGKLKMYVSIPITQEIKLIFLKPFFLLISCYLNNYTTSIIKILTSSERKQFMSI